MHVPQEPRVIKKQDMSRTPSTRRQLEGKKAWVKEWRESLVVSEAATPPSRPSFSRNDVPFPTSGDHSASEWLAIMDLHFTSDRPPSLALCLPESRFGEHATRRRSLLPTSPPPFSKSFSVPSPTPSSRFSSDSDNIEHFAVRRSTSIKRKPKTKRLERYDQGVRSAPPTLTIPTATIPPRVPRKAAALLGLDTDSLLVRPQLQSHRQRHDLTPTTSPIIEPPPPECTTSPTQWVRHHYKKSSCSSISRSPFELELPGASVSAQPPSIGRGDNALRRWASFENTALPSTSSGSSKMWNNLLGSWSSSSKSNVGSRPSRPIDRMAKTLPGTLVGKFGALEFGDDGIEEIDIVQVKRRTREDWESESERLRFRIRESLGY